MKTKERVVSKKIEVLANIAVIATAILLCVVLTKKYLLPRALTATAQSAQVQSSSTDKQRNPLIPPGTQISLPGIDFTKSNRTVLLALQIGCHFCSESAPFYQKIQQQKNQNVRLVAVLPQSIEDSRTYLQGLGVSPIEVAQATLASIRVSGTPTLLLLNQNGIVTDSWVGKLPDSEVAKVINRINETAQ
jgi:hypothetical protein